MATECSHLQWAIITLVREFHSAANHEPSMTVAQFRTFVCRRMPSAAEKVQNESILRVILQQMGVERGRNISFDNFWMFVKLQANEQFIYDTKGDSTCIIL